MRLAGVEVGTVDDDRVRRRAGRGGAASPTGHAGQDHRPIARHARSLSLLGEGVRRHHAVGERHAAAGLGLHPSQQDAGAARRRRRRRDEGLEQATALIQDIRAGKGTVGKLFTDDALYREMNTVLDVGRRRGRRHQSRQGDARPADQRSGGVPRAGGVARQPADLITTRINAGEGSLGRLLNDDALRQVADVDDGEPRSADRRGSTRAKARSAS